MLNHWKIIHSLKDKNVLDKDFVLNNLNRNILIKFLSQSDKTIDIAKYISQYMFNKDNYLIYLYCLSNYPKDLNLEYIKSNKNNENLNLLLDILNSNRNDVLNILKTMDKNRLNKLKEHYEIYKDEEFDNDLDKEEFYLDLN